MLAYIERNYGRVMHDKKTWRFRDLTPPPSTSTLPRSATSASTILGGLARTSTTASTSTLANVDDLNATENDVEEVEDDPDEEDLDLGTENVFDE